MKKKSLKLKQTQPRYSFLTPEQVLAYDQHPGVVAHRAEQAKLKDAAAQRRKEAKKAAKVAVTQFFDELG